MSDKTKIQDYSQGGNVVVDIPTGFQRYLLILNTWERVENGSPDKWDTLNNQQNITVTAIDRWTFGANSTYYRHSIYDIILNDPSQAGQLTIAWTSGSTLYWYEIK